MYSDFNFEKVYLMLGEACDFHCRHCLQHPYHNTYVKSPSDKLINYIQFIADLKPRPPCKSKSDLSVIFFGGEPLLYMKSIKEVVSRLDRPNIVYSIISNGNKLDEEKVRYFNEHKITFILSNDGRNTDRIRDRNVLEDEGFLKLFNKLERKGICSTITAYNQDLFDLWDYIESKVGKVPISYEFLVHSFEMPKDIYDYDLEKWNECCVRLKNEFMDVYRNHPHTHSRAVEFMMPWINNTFRFVSGKAKFPLCGAYRTNINLDLDGNHYLCHNGICKFSDCSKDGVTVAKEAEILFTEQEERHGKPCDHCEYLPFCHEGCPFSVWSEPQKKQCEFMKIFFEQVSQTMGLVEEENTTEIEL